MKLKYEPYATSILIQRLLGVNSKTSCDHDPNALTPQDHDIEALPSEDHPESESETNPDS